MTHTNPLPPSRRALLRAFSAPGRARAEVHDVVTRFMGDSPVPPAWTLVGVRGVFGRRIAREWARHLRHRVSGFEPGVRGRQWRVQTVYDFGVEPGEVCSQTFEPSGVPADDYAALRLKLDEVDKLLGKSPQFVDETWKLLGGQAPSDGGSKGHQC